MWKMSTTRPESAIEKSIAQQRIKKRLIKAVRALRAKYNLLQTLKRRKTLLLEESLLPIVRPLRELNADNKRKAEEELKREPKKEKKELNEHDDRDDDVIEATVDDGDEEDDDDYETGDDRDASSASTSSFAKRRKIEKVEDEDEDEDDDDARRGASLFDEYANKRGKDVDIAYGPKVDPNDKNSRVLGAKKIKFDETTGEIVLSDGVGGGGGGGRSKFKGTRGLFELLFAYRPERYSADDLENYKRMLAESGAHLKSDGKINANKGYKYKNVIARLFPPAPSKPKSGAAIDVANDVGVDASMLVTDNKIDYVHWNDPNVLVERYALLEASERAGNTSHANEKASILNELRRAEYI